MTTYSGDSDGELDESGELPADEDEESEAEDGGAQDESVAEPEPEAGLVDRKKELAARTAARKAVRPVAPTTPAPPPPAAIAGEGRNPLGKRKRTKPGKPGEKRRGPPPARAAVGAAGVAEMNAEAGHPPPGVEALRAPGAIDPNKEASGDIVARWPLVLEALAEEGLGPEAVTLRVHAVAEGPYATQPTYLGTIDGRVVCGGGDVSPADALALFVERVYHSGMRGAVRYSLDVHYKVVPHWRPRGASYICRGALALQPYEVIVAQRRREDEFFRQSASFTGQPSTLGPLPRPGIGAVPGAQGQTVAQAAPPGFYLPGPPSPPAAPSYSEEFMREIFGRLLRGETIGPQALGAPAAPAMMYPPPPPPAPVEPPPPPPTLEEQLEGFARMMKLVQSLQPAPIIQQAPAVGVGRAPREEAAIVRAAAPESAVDQLKGALSLLRDFRKINEELSGMTNAGDDDDDEEPAPKVEAPFQVAELPGGYKWPHGKGLGRMDQIQQFAMLNPNVTVKFVEGLSKILDQSAIRQMLEYLVVRGNPGQQQVAQQALQQPGFAGPPTHLPPVVRQQPSSPPPAANGMPVAPPVSMGFTPVT